MGRKLGGLTGVREVLGDGRNACGISRCRPGRQPVSHTITKCRFFSKKSAVARCSHRFSAAMQDCPMKIPSDKYTAGAKGVCRTALLAHKVPSLMTVRVNSQDQAQHWRFPSPHSCNPDREASNPAATGLLTEQCRILVVANCHQTRLEGRLAQWPVTGQSSALVRHMNESGDRPLMHQTFCCSIMGFGMRHRTSIVTGQLEDQHKWHNFCFFCT